MALAVKPGHGVHEIALEGITLQVSAPPGIDEHGHGALLQVLGQGDVAFGFLRVAEGVGRVFGDYERRRSAGHHQHGMALTNQLLDETQQGDGMGIADQHGVRLAVLGFGAEQAGLALVEFCRITLEAAFVQIGGIVLGDDGVELATFFGDTEAQVIGDADGGLDGPDDQQRHEDEHHE